MSVGSKVKKIIARSAMDDPKRRRVHQPNHAPKIRVIAIITNRARRIIVSAEIWFAQMSVFSSGQALSAGIGLSGRPNRGRAASILPRGGWDRSMLYSPVVR